MKQLLCQDSRLNGAHRYLRFTADVLIFGLKYYFLPVATSVHGVLQYLSPETSIKCRNKPEWPAQVLVNMERYMR